MVLADKGAPAAQALAFGGSGGAGWRPGGAAQAFAGGACVDVDASMACGGAALPDVCARIRTPSLDIDYESGARV